MEWYMRLTSRVFYDFIRMVVKWVNFLEVLYVSVICMLFEIYVIFEWNNLWNLDLVIGMNGIQDCISFFFNNKVYNTSVVRENYLYLQIQINN